MRKGNVGRSAERRVTVLIVAVIALFFISVSYAFYTNNKYTHKGDSPDMLVREDSEAVDSAYQKDSDGDGLADWEELLWDMDPNNPDTDGDGIGDKADVLNERTALIDPQEEAVESFTKQTTGALDTENATEVMARELFGSYMYNLKEGGVTLSEEKEQEIVDHALEVVSPVIEPPKYTIDDVTVVSATQENRMAYIEKVRSTLLKMIDGVTSEHEAIYAIGQSNIKWAATELNKTVAQYSRHVETLKNMPVPSDAVTTHTNMVQAMLFYIYVLEGFAAVAEDPLRTAASARVFPGAEQALNESYTAMRTYMDRHTVNSEL